MDTTKLSIRRGGGFRAPPLCAGVCALAFMTPTRACWRLPSGCPKIECGNMLISVAELHKRLEDGVPLKAELAPPDDHEVRLLVPVLLLALGVAVLTSGSIGTGLLVILGAAGWLGVDRWKGASAARGMAKWKRLRYCEGCGGKFDSHVLAA